jgi:molecular chaperone HtpG
VSGRILGELDKLASDDRAAFESVWEAFGAVLKEGLYEDAERRDALYRIARFRTTRDPKAWRSLADYLADLRPNQTAIYYALGDNDAAIRASPQLEGFAARGIEVLALADAVDAFWVRTALGYEGKPFRSVTQGAADLDAVPRLEAAQAGESAPEAAVATLAALFKQALGDKVSAVRASARLATSPVCLVAGDLALDRQLERILTRAGQVKAAAAPVLEVNPAHPLIKALARKAAAGGAAEAIADAAVILYGEARILDGEAPDEAADHAARVARLIERGLG